MPHRRLILDAFIAAVLLTILRLTSSFFIQVLVDSVFVLGRKSALNWLGLGMLLVTLARAGFFGLRSYLVAHLSERIAAETMRGLHCCLLGLPLMIPAAVMLMNWKLMNSFSPRIGDACQETSICSEASINFFRLKPSSLQLKPNSSQLKPNSTTTKRSSFPTWTKTASVLHVSTASLTSLRL